MDIAGVGVPSGNMPSNRSSIRQEDFLKVLLAQLQFQDTLKPLDNNEFIAQFAQLTNLEQTQQLNDKLDTLLAVQYGRQAIDLIGKSLEAATNSGSTVGEVVSVAFHNGVPSMTLKIPSGEFIGDISLGQVRIIR